MSNVLIVCYSIIAIAYIQSIYYNCYNIVLICLFSILVSTLLLSRNVIQNDVLWFKIYYSIFKEKINIILKKRGLVILIIFFLDSKLELFLIEKINYINISILKWWAFYYILFLS